MATISGSQTGVDAHDAAGITAAASDGALASDGYSFVAQYIDQNDDPNHTGQTDYTANGPSGGSLTYAQASADLAAGLPIVSIFETNGMGTSPYDTSVPSNSSEEIIGTYLSVAQGETDAKEALNSAEDLGQPTGSAIYFALDFDTGPPGYIPQAQQKIEDYLKGISQVFAQSGYKIGVYGAAQALQWVTTDDPANGYTANVSYTWLAQSNDWAGYGPSPSAPNNTKIIGPNGNTTTHGWTMIQGDQTTASDGPHGSSVAVDPDTTASGDFGAWSVQLPPPCYVTGTRILTEHGEMAVENLSVGDLVVTASGELRSIKWIGHRRVDLVRHPEPASVQPVRVEAGAFGPGLPARDLWISPGHNVLFDDTLIPACLLVNGATVTQVPLPNVTYWHVELESHDILIAEGLAAESYLDTGNRESFENGGVFLEAHPALEPKHEVDTCAPIVKSGGTVSAARARLLTRAAELGYATATLPDLHILADGRRIYPIDLGSRRYAFVLPPGCNTIALTSRTFVPRHVDPGSDDSRAMGVCVSRLQIDGEDVDLGSLALPGWHELEQYSGDVQRWTKAMASLPSGARLVVVDLIGEGSYWVLPHDAVPALFG